MSQEMINATLRLSIEFVGLPLLPKKALKGDCNYEKIDFGRKI